MTPLNRGTRRAGKGAHSSPVANGKDRNISGALAFPERPAIYQMYIQVERIP
ncbi:MAG: hypothetical protein ABI769_03510 [Pseudomonadota bacterium]